MIIPLVEDLASLTGVSEACALLGRSRAGHYRARKEAERRAALPFGGSPWFVVISTAEEMISVPFWRRFSIEYGFCS